MRAGEIMLPLVRLEKSQKAAEGVSLNDLAIYLDRQMSDARSDMEKLGQA